MSPPSPMVIVHLSDVHLWRYTLDPRRLLGKRAVGVLELLAGRARRFREADLPAVVDRALALQPDHVLVTGDLSTTSLETEFAAARERLAPLLADPDRATVLPGNHDRYTRDAARSRAFETYFGAFQPARDYPWLRRIDDQTAILGLDPARPHLTASGYLPPAQLDAARALIPGDSLHRSRRLIVACHYPVAAPPAYKRKLALKEIVNVAPLRSWLAGIGRHVYACGHVHAPWAFVPDELPNQLCVNPGPPTYLARDGRPAGFLEIRLDEGDVTITHHGLGADGWSTRTLARQESFFG